MSRLRVDADLPRLGRTVEPVTGADAGMSMPWDGVTRTVAQAMVTHLPDVTATEAYYHLVMRHVADALWRLGAADVALHALTGVLTDTAREVRSRLNDASATTRTVHTGSGPWQQ